MYLQSRSKDKSMEMTENTNEHAWYFLFFIFVIVMNDKRHESEKKFNCWYRLYTKKQMMYLHFQPSTWPLE